jgi:hypothetical protein
MTGRLLEAVRMVPPALWQHLVSNSASPLRSWPRCAPCIGAAGHSSSIRKSPVRYRSSTVWRFVTARRCLFRSPCGRSAAVHNALPIQPIGDPPRALAGCVPRKYPPNFACLSLVNFALARHRVNRRDIPVAFFHRRSCRPKPVPRVRDEFGGQSDGTPASPLRP